MKNRMKLYGDGVHDDSVAIQALLDRREPLVKLPPPTKFYLISKTLRIHSNQELKLDRFSVVRLAKQSNCYMLANDDFEGGNENIAISGGIWDYNNLEQNPNYQLVDRMVPPPKLPGDPYPPNSFHPDRYRGIALFFVNVKGFSMSGLTLRNPVTYGSQFAKLTYFTIEDISFDFETWNPAPNNMDGIHLDGGCHFGRIANLKGTCYDDLVALNANDGDLDTPFEGPISDIDIDGIFAENCHSAVRLLSAGDEIKRVSIRNVYGTFYRYTIGITHFFTGRPRGVFDDILLENFSVGKTHPHPDDFNTSIVPEYPIVFIESDTDVERLCIDKLQRDEREVAIPTILIGQNASVDCLTIRDSSCKSHLHEPLDFLVNDGHIRRLSMQNVMIYETKAGLHGNLISGSGLIDEILK